MAISEKQPALVLRRSGPESVGPNLKVVFISFMFYGFGWGLYTAVLPAIRANSEVTNGEFGTALLGMALTAMPVMLTFGRLLDRFGRAPAVIAAALFALTLPLPIMA